jgi:hypothetical protein
VLFLLLRFLVLFLLQDSEVEGSVYANIGECQRDGVGPSDILAFCWWNLSWRLSSSEESITVRRRLLEHSGWRWIPSRHPSRHASQSKGRKHEIRGPDAGSEKEIQCVTTVGAAKKDRDSFTDWDRVDIQIQNVEQETAAEFTRAGSGCHCGRFDNHNKQFSYFKTYPFNGK